MGVIFCVGVLWNHKVAVFFFHTWCLHFTLSVKQKRYFRIFPRETQCLVFGMHLVEKWSFYYIFKHFSSKKKVQFLAFFWILKIIIYIYFFWVCIYKRSLVPAESSPLAHLCLSSCLFLFSLQTSKEDLLQADFEGALKFFRVQLPKRYRAAENARRLMEQACNIKVREKLLA